MYNCTERGSMNNKEEKILKEIVNYVMNNMRIPTMRYLQKIFKYKSINSITEYLKSLESQNYLIRNKDGKLILNKDSEKYQSNLKTIKIINAKNKYIKLFLDKNKRYVAYKIHHNYFNNLAILNGDILIIEIKKKLKDNNLGLFLIDNNYRIMKYSYKDGFYILKDNEELILSKINLIGKVIYIERKTTF